MITLFFDKGGYELPSLLDIFLDVALVNDLLGGVVVHHGA
jgi:hypothetical protein